MLDFNDTFSDISSSSSTSTFDFTELLDPNEFQLLSRSLSLEALPPITDDDLPPYNVPPFPLNRHLTSAKLDENLKTDLSAMLTVPSVFTKPRGNLDANAGNQTMSFELYDLAREDIELTETKFFYHDVDMVPSINRVPRKSRTSERRSSIPDAPPYEYATMPRTGERTMQWPNHISMNQEMADMMHELHNLNSFFKAGLQDLDQSIAVSDKRKERPEPPSLMVSNSHCDIPLSLDSSENVLADPPVSSLAARRGKDHIAPLMLKNAKYDALLIDYPEIPTSFLGSPSSYSPKFEHANGTDDPSMDLEDMISSLRSHCASICPDSPLPTQFNGQLVGTMNLSAEPRTQPFINGDDTDEWAFANSFLPNLDGSTADTGANHKVHASRQLHHAPVPPVPTGSRSGAPTWTTDLNIKPTYEVARSPPRGPPPFNPPPPLPGLSSPTAGSPHKVRGILKNSKNVRFASLPDPGSKSVENVEIPPSRRRQSVALVPIDRPSRLRPKSNTVTGSTPPLVLPRGHDTISSPPPKDTTRGTPEGSRPVSLPTSNDSDGFRSRGSITPVQTRAPLITVSRQSITPTQKPAPLSLGRHSLGRAVKADNKEHDRSKIRASHTPSLSKRWTNENNFRRASDASQITPKSRMPVPLRNILTRFK